MPEWAFAHVLCTSLLQCFIEADMSDIHWLAYMTCVHQVSSKVKTRISLSPVDNQGQKTKEILGHTSLNTSFT